MVGILYKEGMVYLVGDKKKINHAETFEIASSLADLFSKIVSGAFKNEKTSKDFLQKYRSTVMKAYLEIMKGHAIGNLLNNVQSRIEDDMMGFELKPDEHFKSYLVVTPKSNISILSTLIYCMLMMLTELSGDINYVLKGPDFIEHFRYINPKDF